MAKRKAKKKVVRKTKTRAASKRRTKKSAPAEFIISKSRTKAAAGINVSGEFYAALDEAVRELIAKAEQRAMDNNRRTLRPHDL